MNINNGKINEKYFFMERKNITNEDCNKIHSHNSVEVIFIKEGDLNIAIDYKLYHLSTGDIIFVNSNIAHSLLLSSGESAEVFFVNFLPESIYLYGNDLFNITYFFWLTAEPANKFFIYNLPASHEVERNIYRAYQIYQNREVGYEYAFLYRVIMLCVWFFEQWWIKSKKKLPEFSYTNIVVLRKIFEDIEKNYSTITINDVSNKYNLSRNAVAKQFKETTDGSFRKYVEKIKISKAMYMLITTNKPVTEIAFETGYNNSSYFSKLFAEYAGFTPAVFRRENQVQAYLKRLSSAENVDKTVRYEEINPEERLKDANRLFYNSISLSAYYDLEVKRGWMTVDFYEIIYADLGETYVEFETEIYKLSPGEVMLVFPYTRRRVYSPEEGGNCILWMQFYPAVLNVGTNRFNFFDRYKNTYKIFNISKQNEPDIINSLFDVYREGYKYEPSSELIMRANILNLMSWMMKLSASEMHELAEESDDKSSAKISEIRNYVDEHYTEHITLEELSEKFYISYSHLSRKFKETTRCNLKRYINNVRLMRASFLLAATNYTVTEIASMLGFCSRNRFAEKYFKFAGCSPSEYRKRFRNKEALNDDFKLFY